MYIIDAVDELIFFCEGGLEREEQILTMFLEMTKEFDLSCKIIGIIILQIALYRN